jgi:hypothetical protein
MLLAQFTIAYGPLAAPTPMSWQSPSGIVAVVVEREVTSSQSLLEKPASVAA